MKVSAQEVKYIAQLARLEIGEEEMGDFVKQFNDILVYAGMLDRLDTKNVASTAHVLDYGNVMREDAVKLSMSQGAALANAAAVKDGGYLVPRVMEGGEA